ncbi:MAG: response regulator [Dehalococcoidia bacterium]
MPEVRTRRIVAVDDDERTLRVLVDALGSSSQHVLTFDRGEVALMYLEEAHECDLLILDVEMPGMDGFAVARAVRALPHLASMPILALTGMTGPGDAVAILRAGADAYQAKPVDIRELRALVERLVSPSILSEGGDGTA